MKEDAHRAIKSPYKDKIDGQLRQLINFTRYDLLYGPFTTDICMDCESMGCGCRTPAKYPGFPRAIDILKDKLDFANTTVYYNEEDGNVTETEPDDSYLECEETDPDPDHEHNNFCYVENDGWIKVERKGILSCIVGATLVEYL